MATAEQKKQYAVIKAFKGLNTKANRTAIDEDEFSWLENAQPIGPSNLKIVPTYTNVGYTFSNTVSFLTTANLGQNDYILGWESNGAAQYYNLTLTTSGNIAGNGTFSTANVSAAQWKNERVVIGDPNNGLFTWDGANLVSVGAVGFVALTAPGNGYVSAPNVTISAPDDANGIQATAVASISTNSNTLSAIIVNNGGNGYTTVPLVNIGAPQLTGGTQATASAAISGGNVVYITLTNPGSGYITPPAVTISGGGGSNANAIAYLSNGSVLSVTLTNAGSGYRNSPSVTFTGGGGNGANAIAELSTFKVGTLGVVLTSGGTNYTSAPTVTIGDLTGWTTRATAVATLSGNTVSQIIVTNPGAGYTSASNITVSITGGGGTGAKANAVVTTDQIASVATFSGRTWVAQGRTVYFSAAGTYSDFTSVSAGSLTLTDSTLHGNIRLMIPANNFLYVFGDDSINVFSDVRVQSNGTTIFTNTNISASIGTKRIYAVFPYFRSVLFMNDYGIYALVGSTTSKISDPLDGLFPLIDFTQPISGGQVLLNNILCAAFSFTYKDPIVGSRPIQAVFFEKKWFLTSQGNVSYIASTPFGGSINLYGTNNGNSLVKLYSDSVSNITSNVQTALMPMGDPIRTKQALKFGIEATLTNGASLAVTVNSESNSSNNTVYSLSATNSVVWVNNSNQIVTWQNNSPASTLWQGQISGYYLYKSDAQQYGKYLGMTINSNSPNFIYHTFEFEQEQRVRF